MQRIALILITGVIALTAVEWNKERITDDSNFHVNPVLVLDSHGHARVLYIETDEVSGESWLKLASNEAASWEIREVAPLSEYYSEYEIYYFQTHSLDLNSEDDAYVAFFDLINDELSDLYLATDVTGDFEVDTLTSDMVIQTGPIVQIDAGDHVTMTYVEFNQVAGSVGLRFGWMEQGELVSESITDNIYLEELIPTDFILDSDDVPHVFFTGSDYYLWHAEPSVVELEGWDTEHVSSLPYGFFPSAAGDASGNLHVTYRTGEMNLDSLMYATDKSGSWQEELVTQTGEPFYDWYDLPSTVLGPEGRPHTAWGCYWEEYPTYGIHYSERSDTGWFSEDISDTLSNDEVPGMGHYFAIDQEGYGHIVYAGWDSENFQIYYAKSSEPLEGVGIVEHPVDANPFSLEIRDSRVRFSLPQSSLIRLNLYDATGSKVEEIARGFYPSGEHSIPLSTVGIARGVYFVQLQGTGFSASARVTIVR